MDEFTLVNEYGWNSYREIMYTMSFYRKEYYPNKEKNTLYVVFEPTDAFDLTKLSHIFWYNKPDNISFWLGD